MSQPSLQPLAMYSSIFSLSFLRLSLGDFTSIKKNGQTGRNFLRCSAVIDVNCPGEIQAASGARFAPFGKINPPLESVTMPLPIFRDQLNSCAAMETFWALDSPPDG